MTATPTPAAHPAPPHPDPDPASSPGSGSGPQPGPAPARTPSPAGSTLAARAAVLLAEIVGPAVLVTALLVIIAWHNAPDLGHGLLWGALSVLFGTVAPMAFVFHGVRHHRWSDHHVPERRRRMPPMLFGCASIALGCLLLRLTDAPRGIITVYLAMIAEAAVLTAITKFWKISGHVAAAASCATVLTFVYGPVLGVTWLLVPAVAWSRVQVRRIRLTQGPAEDHDELDGHTPAQTVAGAVLAAATVAAVYLTR